MRLWLCRRHLTAIFSAYRFRASCRLVEKIRSLGEMLTSRNSKTGCLMLSELQTWRILLQSKCEFLTYPYTWGEKDNGYPSFSNATIAEMSLPCSIARSCFLYISCGIFCRKPRHLTLTLTFFVNQGTVNTVVLKTWRGCFSQISHF